MSLTSFRLLLSLITISDRADKKRGSDMARMRSRIERLCRRRGLSVYRLSKETGIPTCTFTSWKKKGLEKASFGAMVKVARALRVPVEDLYEEEP